ncbi:hypothetical protein, partial [Streptomyces sp. DSM 41033]|uniref:hypothetical protein n=1 Tax=Streptomyces sp. DSM 41033 TaxID=3448655 RepID=UPI00403FC9DB
MDDGSDLTLPSGVLLADETFVGPDGYSPSVADQRLLDLAAPQRRREAEFWYSHMYEVKYGIALTDRGIIEVPAPISTVASRLAAKQRELLGAGLKVSTSTMWRKWRGFNHQGIAGCLDMRGMPGHVRSTQIDQRIATTVDAIRDQFIEKSTPTKKQIIEMAKHRL